MRQVIVDWDCAIAGAAAAAPATPPTAPCKKVRLFTLFYLLGSLVTADLAVRRSTDDYPALERPGREQRRVIPGARSSLRSRWSTPTAHQSVPCDCHPLDQDGSRLARAAANNVGTDRG